MQNRFSLRRQSPCRNVCVAGRHNEWSGPSACGHMTCAPSTPYIYYIWLVHLKYLSTNLNGQRHPAKWTNKLCGTKEICVCECVLCTIRSAPIAMRQCRMHVTNILHGMWHSRSGVTMLRHRYGELVCVCVCVIGMREKDHGCRTPHLN